MAVPSASAVAWPVADIIRDVCERAGVSEDLLNMTEIFGDKYPVYGCFATPEDDAFTLIEELQKLHTFDTCNFDGRLNFIKRGGDVVADISLDELVDSNREIDKHERKDAIEIPRVLNLEYYDIEGDLAPNKQISDRSLDIRAKDEEKQETAVILTANQAKQMVTITHKVLIEEQGGGYEFSLPDSYAWLTTGDLIRLDGIRLRITEVEIDDGLQNYKTVLDRASAYTSSIKGVPPSKPVDPEDLVFGETFFEFLDIPILSDADDQLLFYSALNGLDRWVGAGVDLSLDGGANYIDSDTSVTPSVIGYLDTDLQAGSVYYPDSVNSVRVRMIRNDLELESATLAEMMNRKNLCVIGNELVNFGNATEIEQGLWELDYFLRGRKGTVSDFHPSGERFVMLRRPVLATVPAETYLLNKQMTFRATSIGNDTPSAIKTYLYEGVSQRERMPGYLRATRDGGNIVISWQGVGRIGAGSNVSQSQHWQGYRVYINGVAQPIQTSTGLTVADPSGNVTIEVCQINQFTGEGPRARIKI
jgi:hypothetical protein